jgi:hypothetical protein
MARDQEEMLNRVERERTNAAFEVTGPAQDTRVGPRLIPVDIAVVVGLVILALLFTMPR